MVTGVIGDQTPELDSQYRWKNPIASELFALILMLIYGPMLFLPINDIVVTVPLVLVWACTNYLIAVDILEQVRYHRYSFGLEIQEVVLRLVPPLGDEGISVQEVKEDQKGCRSGWKGPGFQRTILASQQGITVMVGIYDPPVARYLPNPWSTIYIGPVRRRTKSLISRIETIIDRELQASEW